MHHTSPPALDVAENDICFHSYSYYPIDDYIVMISDLTGEMQSVNQSSKVDNPKTCFSLMEESFPLNVLPMRCLLQHITKSDSQTPQM